MRDGDTPPQGFKAVNARGAKTPWERWTLLAVAVAALAIGAFLITRALSDNGSKDEGRVTDSVGAPPAAQPAPPAPAHDTTRDEVQKRQAIVALLENDIEKDAKKRVRRGELDGPILRVQC